MKQKYQIFISSTYSDLIEERQACVEAVLRAGHIPAGMELFSSGNESQLETIKRWIEDCEIYMLILGGRYGSIEPKSSLSYTEIEYRYAIELNKPFFAIVMSDTLLNEKVKEKGKDILELENPNKLKDFKDLVLSKTCRFFNNTNDIKLSILESLIDIQNRNTIKGWIKASEMPDSGLVLTQLTELSEKNKNLEEKLKASETQKKESIGNYTFEELLMLLNERKVLLPKEVSGDTEDKTVSLLELFIKYQIYLSIGISNRANANRLEAFLVFNLISYLRIYDLAETVKVPNVAWSKFQTSKLGNQFLAMLTLKKNQEKALIIDTNDN